MGQIVNKKAVITKTTNAILVLPKDHIIIRKKEKNSSINLKRAAAACCQCSMCTDLCPRNQLGHPIEPHQFMLAATCKDEQKTGAFVNTLFCSSCGLCEMYSCTQGLSPRTLINEYKIGLGKAGLTVQSCVEKELVGGKPVNATRNLRRVPMERLIARLGLKQYDKKAVLIEERKETGRVKILFSQHIGAPAIPQVKLGDYVKQGQMVGIWNQGLSVPVHGSITGKVVEVNEKYVIIEKVKGCESYE